MFFANGNPYTDGVLYLQYSKGIIYQASFLPDVAIAALHDYLFNNIII